MMELMFSKVAAYNFGLLLFICSFAASFQEPKTSMIEFIFNKVANCRIQRKY